jgi:hypothetical protein
LRAGSDPRCRENCREKFSRAARKSRAKIFFRSRAHGVENLFAPRAAARRAPRSQTTTSLQFKT